MLSSPGEKPWKSPISFMVRAMLELLYMSIEGRKELLKRGYSTMPVSMKQGESKEAAPVR